MKQYRDVWHEVIEDEPYHLLRIYEKISDDNFKLVGGHNFFKNAPCVETIRETIDEVIYGEYSDE